MFICTFSHFLSSLQNAPGNIVKQPTYGNDNEFNAVAGTVMATAQPTYENNDDPTYGNDATGFGFDMSGAGDQYEGNGEAGDGYLDVAPEPTYGNE